MRTTQFDLGEALEHGEADARREMGWRTQKLLRRLADGKWHRKILTQGVGIGTVEFCIDQGLARTKRYNRRQAKGCPPGIGAFCIAVRITRLGRRILRDGSKR